jgi:hypothetical protein
MSKKIQLFDHQKLAVNQLKTGSILCGGVGSGKTLTSIFYYKKKEFPKDLYVITTAQKRDTLDWERECAYFAISRDRTASLDGVQLTVDSWNNIKKYIEVKDAFFIFDEQRVIGSGSWVKSFYKITKQNNWILLSATPGDTWMDYIPVFVANRFYKNRTEFIRRHVVFNSFTKFPKVDHYVEEGRLARLRNSITVTMDYIKPTVQKFDTIFADYDKGKFDLVFRKRWNPFTNRPVKEVSEYCFTMRKVVNSDLSRLNIVRDILVRHRKIIIFYSFNYELEILRELKKEITLAEYNGHKHEPVPIDTSWVYLVQYTSGSEGWNCIETNTIVFYSLHYSYRIMTQAAGRIDRLNTPFSILYYFYIRSKSQIDIGIAETLKDKKDFNEFKFVKNQLLKGEKNEDS